MKYKQLYPGEIDDALVLAERAMVLGAVLPVPLVSYVKRQQSLEPKGNL